MLAVAAAFSLLVTVALTGDVSMTYFTASTLSTVAALSADVIKGVAADSALTSVASFSANVKKANPITDHDVIVFGQILPRPWYGQIKDRRWSASMQSDGTYQGELKTKHSNGILYDKKNFGMLLQRRWEGTNQ
jgi:hypothetical protein